VHNLKAGDHVVVCYYLTCGSCRYCRTGRDTLCQAVRARIGLELDGGFAEYVAIPATAAFRIASSLPLDQAATLADAGAAAWHAVHRKGRVLAGDRVVIVGAGGLGLFAIQMARLSGATVVAIDQNEEKLDVARRMGADEAIATAGSFAQAVLTNGRADVVVDLVGEPETLTEALHCLRPDGRLVLVAYGPTGRPWPVDPKQVVVTETTLVGSRGSYKQDLVDVIDMVERGRVRPVVGQVAPLEAANEVLSALARGDITGRAVLDPRQISRT
jgi:propanol-preferring alcohol dehydrogenase